MNVHCGLCPSQSSETVTQPSNPAHSDPTSWPVLDLTMECFRVVLPSRDFSSALLLNMGALQITYNLSYPTSDLRYILNNSAFRRLSLLSSERKQPPLPAYQLDSYAISVWGLRKREIYRT